MSLLLFVLVLCGLLALYIYCRRIYSYWDRQGIPVAPYSIPIVGHLLPLLLLQKNISQLVISWYERYKNNSMVGYYDGMVPGLIVRDPELIKMILQTNFTNFHENAMKVDQDVDPLMAKNPFFSKGEIWLVGRKRLTYAFSSMRLKILSETVQKVCKKFDDYLSRKIKDDQRIEFETKDLFGRFTGEVVANAGYGIEGFCFDDNYNPQSFHEIGKKIFKTTWFHGTLQSIMFFLPFLNNYLKIRLIPKDIDHFFRTIVKQVIDKRREENEKRNDFFQLMVDLENSEGQKFDEESLSAHALSFFVDGYETSSATLSFICFELSIHCDIQEKLRNEIKQVLDKHQGEITYDSLKEMTYLDQVINESQRMHTLLDIMGKMCTDNIELKANDGLNCKIESGTKIIIPIKSLQRDPKYWINPEAFDPDRWNEQRKSEINKYCFLPFGEGPRICVGLRMGLLQVKASLATLLMKYRIERNPRTSYPVKIGLLGVLSTPIDGLWVYLKRL
ncbi:cytochrome P450 6a2-like [Vespa mandarinia]|uniref:cytochrome P450 6a2-like n=1 Tax=Vespa mandarinia TaxID=7446 RepID=UPI001622AAE4|nr:cytochrome P450 6a2-like [Vespa mandarinia]XP_035733371.1 cytochrome P450 6a2-like [Vespa mandarinia]XP_035733372.1 cytochrome P450 6a2-like [Vespa mandarinia]XP_035733373.1 cytochrome P450 6a2-like [Vespa mandarinia]